MNAISINPVLTSNGLGSFNIESTGYIQGTALDQPAVRYSLAGGILNPNAALPMWGGVGISELVPSDITGGTIPETGQSATLGGVIDRATNISIVGAALSLTGFSVFDQNYAGVNSPQSPVPLSAGSMLTNFYRLGSGARIAVNCAPGLVNARGVIITQQVSWDFVNQMLIPYSVAYPQTTITGAVWANTLGGQTTFTVGTDLTSYLNAGDVIETSGVISTAAVGAFNGQFVVVSVDSTHVVVTQLAAASPGTYVSGGIIGAGGGALPVRVLDVQLGNSMTVDYDAVTGFATWNRSGNAAIILI